MANTTNFGWETPDDTDLVKDGASAMRTLGNAIDTSLVDLKGGTTGQVLSKASNTDMDFTWSSVDPLTILDAKGDLISATAADTPARLAVGADGTYLQADSTTSTGLKWGSVSAGGKTLLSTTTLSGASTTISSISGSYIDLEIYIYGVTGNTSNNSIRFWFNGDTGGQFLSGTKFTGGNSYIGYSADRGNLIPSEATLRTSATNAFFLGVKNYASTASRKPINGYGYAISSTPGDVVVNFGGYFQGTAAVTSVTFDYGGTATFAGGTVLIYGVK